jgi:hypothetical protein
MGRPFDRKSFDAFTPTGSGQPFNQEFPAAPVPAHAARYTRLPYLTDAATRAKLRRRGDTP